MVVVMSLPFKRGRASGLVDDCLVGVRWSTWCSSMTGFPVEQLLGATGRGSATILDEDELPDHNDYVLTVPGRSSWRPRE